MHQSPGFADALKQTRTAPAAQHHGQDVQGRDVGMAQLGNVPGKMQVPQFHRGFLYDFPGRRLPGFRRQHHGRQRAGFGTGVSLPDLGNYLARAHVAGNDKEHIVRRVFFVIVTHDVVALQFVENIRIPDDRVTIWAAGVGGFKQPAAGALVRIVLAHVHFPPDDLLFLGQFIRGKRSVLHDVAEDVHSHPRPGVRHVNVIDGAVKGGVGVHVPAGGLDLLVNLLSRPRGSAFEQHVLQHMR
ncbi:MAG: hypothetical protein BWX84_02011 [Verrucomicrobia bacterium ADurb.Bin118]|nr:MAG: hypothetical protein BWX84_02011 [Verrucomicrobia bacterium ADurb.Bin118]